MAPCTGKVSKEEYNKAIKEIMSFLNGNYVEVEKFLKEEMEKASEALEFEKASEYRDLLKSVMHISQKQNINDNNELDDKDIIACVTEYSDVLIQVFFIRNGKLVGREHYYMTSEGIETESQIINTFIKQFYAGTPYLPRTILVQEDIEDRELIEKWLSEKRKGKVTIKIPLKGKKEQMLELAKKNARMVLYQGREKIKRDMAKTKGALQELEQILDMNSIVRIESYDISNTS